MKNLYYKSKNAKLKLLKIIIICKKRSKQDKNEAKIN